MNLARKKKKIKNLTSHPHKTRRTSPFTFVCRGSATIEMALVFPLFLFAILTFIYLLEVQAIRMQLRGGLYFVGKELAEQAYDYMEGNTLVIQRKLIASMNVKRLQQSIVKDGEKGLDCSASTIEKDTGVYDLQVHYRVVLPVPVFGGAEVPLCETVKVKGWCGYEKGDGQFQQGIVYVTEHGSVYHQRRDCRYLNPTIKAVTMEQLAGLRNAGHRIYICCKSCGGAPVWNRVYITDYGECYHNRMDCSGLKRTVYAVPLSEVGGRGACTKCGF